jgi:RNA polymerase sigma factor (sigma-70 family)
VGVTPTEADLVGRAQAGDGSAFAALVNPHREVAFRTAYMITRNGADADDAVQAGLLSAWRAMRRFRRGAPMRPWLLAIVANEARNRVRASVRRQALTLKAVDAGPRGLTDAEGMSPEVMLLASEERRALLGALEQLGEDDRLVLSCRFLLGLSELETAGALGVRRGTVKSRTSRALSRLRSQLSATPPGGES